MDTRFVKGYCSKTRRYFGLEAKQFGTVWKIVNFTQLSDEEAALVATEVDQAKFETNENLLPCAGCGSRRVGGCGCAVRTAGCSHDMKYNFGCIYCQHLEIDRSFPKRRSGQAGDKVVLSQGQEVRIRYADDRPLREIIVGVGWDPSAHGASMDVDSSVVLLSPNGRSRDLIYFGDLIHPSGCVVHHGDNLTGASDGQNDDENITVSLDKVPSSRNRIVFVLNIYDCDNRRQTLESVRNLYIRLYDPKSRETLIEYGVSETGQYSRKDTAVVIGMAYHADGGWNFKAIGRTLRVSAVGELAECCDEYL